MRALPDEYVAMFWAQVDRSSGPDGCWRWVGRKSSDGTGIARLPWGQTTAHRLAFELQHGEAPAGYVLARTCGQMDCCNPHHIEAMTRSEHRRRQLQRRVAGAAE